MSSFHKYNTRAGADMGLRLELLGPDKKPSGDWIHVLGADAEAYQTANRNLRRSLITFIEEKGIKTKESEEYHRFAERAHCRLQASLVTAWSFDEECNVDNVVALFMEAPYVAEQVDDFAGKREKFAGNWPSPSEPTQASSSV